MSANSIITNGEGATRAKGDAPMFFQQHTQRTTTHAHERST